MKREAIIEKLKRAEAEIAEALEMLQRIEEPAPVAKSGDDTRKPPSGPPSHP